MRYLVACRAKDRQYFSNVVSCVVVKRVAERRVVKEWYVDHTYSPLLPFKAEWMNLKCKFWWDIEGSTCQDDIWTAIQALEDIVKNKEDQRCDIEDIIDTINWLRHWASKGAYFILTK